MGVCLNLEWGGTELRNVGGGRVNYKPNEPQSRLWMVWIGLEMDNQTEETLRVVYGPNEVKLAKRKDDFWKIL